MSDDEWLDGSHLLVDEPLSFSYSAKEMTLPDVYVGLKTDLLTPGDSMQLQKSARGLSGAVSTEHWTLRLHHVGESTTRNAAIQHQPDMQSTTGEIDVVNCCGRASCACSRRLTERNWLTNSRTDDKPDTDTILDTVTIASGGDQGVR